MSTRTCSISCLSASLGTVADSIEREDSFIVSVIHDCDDWTPELIQLTELADAVPCNLEVVDTPVAADDLLDCGVHLDEMLSYG